MIDVTCIQVLKSTIIRQRLKALQRYKIHQLCQQGFKPLGQGQDQGLDQCCLVGLFVLIISVTFDNNETIMNDQCLDEWITLAPYRFINNANLELNKGQNPLHQFPRSKAVTSCHGQKSVVSCRFPNSITANYLDMSR